MGDLRIKLQAPVDQVAIIKVCTHDASIYKCMQ